MFLKPDLREPSCQWEWELHAEAHACCLWQMCWKGTNCSAASRPSALQWSLTHSCLGELNFTPHFRNICLLEGLHHSYGPRSATQKSSVSFPEGWWGKVLQVLRMSCEGAKPADASLCCAVGRGAREGKGFLLLFPWAAPQKQDLVTLKVYLPNYSISLFSYTWERAFMFHQRSKRREGWGGIPLP